MAVGYSSPSGLPGTQPAAMFSQDPAVVQARQETARMVAEYEAQILADRKKALIDYGDPAMVARLLGETPAEGGSQTVYRITPHWSDLQGAPGRYGIKSTAELQAFQQQWGEPRNQLSFPTAEAAKQYALMNGLQEGWFDINPVVRSGAGETGQGAFSAGMLRRLGLNPAGWGKEGATVKATRENPYSTLKMLGYQKDLDFRDLRENMNNANLWYSSERGRREGVLSQSYGAQEHQAARQMQDYLDAQDKQLADLKAQAQSQLAEQTRQAAAQKMNRPGGR